MEDMYNYGESCQRTNTAYVLVTTQLVLSKTQQTLFTPSTTALPPEERRGSTFSSRSSQRPVRAATGLSVQSVSGGPPTRPQIASSSILTPPRRVVVILPQTTASSHRLLTINSKDPEIQLIAFVWKPAADISDSSSRERHKWSPTWSWLEKGQIKTTCHYAEERSQGWILDW